jgi:hypothetical protein
VEEILGSASHVTLYGFDMDAKAWVRDDTSDECATKGTLTVHLSLSICQIVPSPSSKRRWKKLNPPNHYARPPLIESLSPLPFPSLPFPSLPPS